MWQMLGKNDSLAYETYPAWDDKLAADDEKEIVLQVNGKVRSKFVVAVGTGKDELEKMAREDERLAEWIAGKTIIRVIAVPDRLVNFVIKG
jgi:leucyl-tRNA synthetase